MNKLIKFIAGNALLTIALMMLVGAMQASALIATMIKYSGGL
jgi:hypothetical protein